MWERFKLQAQKEQLNKLKKEEFFKHFIKPQLKQSKERFWKKN